MTSSNALHGIASMLAAMALSSCSNFQTCRSRLVTSLLEVQRAFEAEGMTEQRIAAKLDDIESRITLSDCTGEDISIGQTMKEGLTEVATEMRGSGSLIDKTFTTFGAESPRMTRIKAGMTKIVSAAQPLGQRMTALDTATTYGAAAGMGVSEGLNK